MKIMRTPLILLVIVMLTSLSAMAQGQPDAVMTSPEETYIPQTDWNNDDAFDGYMRQLMGIKNAGALYVPRNLGGDLTGLNKVVYNKLKPLIADVAAGKRASTIFVFSAEELGVNAEYTAADLGVSQIYASDDISDKSVTAEAMEALREKVRGSFNLTTQIRVLLSDCPFDMYWFDKTDTGGGTLTFFTPYAKRGSTRAQDCLYYNGNMTIKFHVAKEYAGSEDFTFNTQLAASAQTAAKNARSIVSKYATASDYDKLKGYKDTICDLVEYNFDAAGDGADYGNPWQMVWVFDGNKSTKVVCEGYAKAFQYLCDMTEFASDDLWCYCVNGTFSAPSMSGGHMWNIVHMPNGKNYLVDVTNCDSRDSGGSAIGAPDKLFMKAPTSGSVQNGYTFKLSSSVKYDYKQLSTSLFSTAELTLSGNSYLDDVALVNESVFPDDNFRAFVSSQYDTNRDGTLSTAEIINVTAINVSGKSIASLEGIGRFSSLITLDCSGNKLAELDVSKNTKLRKLNCSGNALKSLDITKCTTLAKIISPGYRLSGSLKHYKSTNAELICDPGVRLKPNETFENVLVLPEGLTAIEEEAFAGIAAEVIVVPEGVISIGSRAFANCANLVEITLPGSIESISPYAFQGSNSVLILSESEQIREWASKRGIDSAEP